MTASQQQEWQKKKEGSVVPGVACIAILAIAITVGYVITTLPDYDQIYKEALQARIADFERGVSTHAATKDELNWHQAQCTAGSHTALANGKALFIFDEHQQCVATLVFNSDTNRWHGLNEDIKLVYDEIENQVLLSMKARLAKLDQ